MNRKLITPPADIPPLDLAAELRRNPERLAKARRYLLTRIEQQRRLEAEGKRAA